MSEINILYCFDNNFWRMAAVSVRSLMLCQKNPSDIVIYCMVAPHTRGKRLMRKIVAEYGARIVWRVVKKSENPYRTRDYSRWSPVIFYRLFAHRIFPHVAKMLYLDSDTVVCGDLTRLFNMEISGYAVGAVRDMAVIEQGVHKLDIEHVRMFLDKHLKNDLYVNSGVLLINMQELAQNEANLLAVDVGLKYPDQDLLNVGLDGKIYELPLKYNFEPSVGTNKTVRNPVVYHFYAIKPYFYSPDRVEQYSCFFKMASPLGFYPEDFARSDMCRYKKKYRCDGTTNIPHLRIDKRGQLRLFGWFRV